MGWLVGSGVGPAPVGEEVVTGGVVGNFVGVPVGAAVGSMSTRGITP